MKCGNRMDDDASFCSACGTPAGQTAPAGQASAQSASATSAQAVSPSAAPATQNQTAGTAAVNTPLPEGATPFDAFALQPLPPGARVNELENVTTEKGKRSAMHVPCTIPVEQAYNTASQILRYNGYTPKGHVDGMIWKKGTGLATAMHYISITPLQDHLYVQGWVMMGIGDATLMEQPLTGFVAALPKSMTKKVITDIQRACQP